MVRFANLKEPTGSKSYVPSHLQPSTWEWHVFCYSKHSALTIHNMCNPVLYFPVLLRGIDVMIQLFTNIWTHIITWYHCFLICTDQPPLIAYLAKTSGYLGIQHARCFGLLRPFHHADNIRIPSIRQDDSRLKWVNTQCLRLVPKRTQTTFCISLSRSVIDQLSWNSNFYNIRRWFAPNIAPWSTCKSYRPIFAKRSSQYLTQTCQTCEQMWAFRWCPTCLSSWIFLQEGLYPLLSTSSGWQFGTPAG